ncbi:unnamed protein product, partial [Amoebophrya sp. A25]|eukprot:GSA25T00021986001.1
MNRGRISGPTSSRRSSRTSPEAAGEDHQSSDNSYTFPGRSTSPGNTHTRTSTSSTTSATTRKTWSTVPHTSDKDHRSWQTEVETSTGTTFGPSGSGGGTSRTQQVDIVANLALREYLQDLTGGDEGVNVIENLQFARPGDILEEENGDILEDENFDRRPHEDHDEQLSDLAAGDEEDEVAVLLRQGAEEDVVTAGSSNFKEEEEDGTTINFIDVSAAQNAIRNLGLSTFGADENEP